jgi:hypothetical protein
LFRRVSLLLSVVVFSACGYHLAAGDLRQVGTIAIVTPRNEAGEPGLDRIVADALRRELLRRSGSRIAESPEKADVVVRGRIVNVQTAARSLSSVVLVLEYETQVTLELDAKRGDQVVVAPTRFEDSERHLASGDVEAQRKNREEALRRIAAMIAARFMDRLGEEQAAR